MKETFTGTYMFQYCADTAQKPGCSIGVVKNFPSKKFSTKNCDVFVKKPKFKWLKTKKRFLVEKFGFFPLKIFDKYEKKKKPKKPSTFSMRENTFSGQLKILRKCNYAILQTLQIGMTEGSFLSYFRLISNKYTFLIVSLDLICLNGF